MKKLWTLSGAVVLFASMAPQALATPMYYTFEGTVSYIYDRNNTGIAGDAGLSRGGPVSYILMLDLDRQGYYSYGSSDYTRMRRQRCT